MQKKESMKWPELVVSIGDANLTQAIRRAVKSGVLRKIASKIYTTNFDDSAESIIKRHRYQIINQLFPNGVISHRSAFDGGISADGSIILSYKYSKIFKLPGLIVRLIRGPGPDPEDTPFLDHLHISSRGRAFLENISPSRERQGFIKRIPRSEVEERLDRVARIYGMEELNRLRDQSRRIASRLEMKKEFEILDRMIGSFLGTQTDLSHKSAVGRARSIGEPFDPQRVELFAILAAHLQSHDLPVCKRSAMSSKARVNQAFFESYFSNYIEGTIFEIEEAEKIIFENKIIPGRSEDSHDILGTYQIVSNRKLMETAPKTAQNLIEILQQRHSILMEARQEAMPGRFKEVVNRAGNTVFVRPEEVRGTLSKGFEFYIKLPIGMQRAVFMMFLISEVHPFVDGNGRIARILMNAELDIAQQSRIIIPTVFREDYLLSLRKLSRQLDPAPYIRMLSYAQKFTSSLSFIGYQSTLEQLKSCNAFLEPSEGKLIINNSRDWGQA